MLAGFLLVVTVSAGSLAVAHDGPARVDPARPDYVRGGDKSDSVGVRSAMAAKRHTTVTARDVDFTPGGRTLRYGSAREADLVAEHLAELPEALRRYLQPSPQHPLYAGGVALAARHGTIAVHEAAGHELRYADADTELPRAQWEPVERETAFDLASLTKVFTALAVMQQVEAGRIDIDTPVASYLPAFAAHGKDGITVRQLLTHTGGLPPWLPLYSAYDSVEERHEAVLSVQPDAPPGARYIYSDLGFITLGLLVEQVTGRSLDMVIASGITGPLGMDDTMFNPPQPLRHRIAATEFQPWTDRGMVRGSAHDENAWSLGGVAGHAGLFSTAHDLAVLAQTLLNGGRYGDARILEPDTVRAVLTNYNTEFAGHEHGLGVELAQRWYMDGLTTPVTFGHTGYTGTSLVVDPLADSFVVLLTNRVHPTRDWGSNNPARRAVARALARANAVRPVRGRDAWFSGTGDDRTAELTLPLTVPEREHAAGPGRPIRVSFDLWWDTESSYDTATFEMSTDNGRTWSPVPFTVWIEGRRSRTDGTVSGFNGRHWAEASAILNGDRVLDETGKVLLRWRYSSDSLYQGRGVYVDGVRVQGPRGLLFNGARPRDAARWRSDGWTRSRN